MARRCVVLAALTLLAGAARAQQPADEAWARGDLAAARRLYAERLAADSSDDRALHRMALLLAWDGRYTAGIALFDRLLALSPDNAEARVDRARVLAWAGRFDASIAGYEEALRRAPGDRGALLGLAQTLAWADRLPSARAVHARLLAANPSDLEARQADARLTAWEGRLVAAERSWRGALVLDPANAATLVGLSQTLRWQGRLDAAREVLDAIPPAHRTVRDYREERREVEAALGPRGAPSVTYETDSDDNRITTFALRAGTALRPRLQMGADLYARTATYEPVIAGARSAWGVLGTARVLVEPGWVVVAGAGASSADGAASETEPALLVAVSTPGRHRLGATLTVQRGAFDATALIIERGVTMTERSLGLRYAPAPRWALEGGTSWTTFEGSAENRRLAAYMAVTHTLAPHWQAATTLRGFGFSEDLADGYFDPGRFLHGELIARWRPLRGRWEASAEAAPGLQQVGSADPLVTARLAARAAWQPAPGRFIGFTALYTNAGLQSFATGGTGYRYVALGVAGAWAF
jgi:tetratricopeptide (TPR) repeat protein